MTLWHCVPDAARSNALWEDRDVDSEGESRVVPLLVHNRIPDGFETEEKLDVSLRPDQVGVCGCV